MIWQSIRKEFWHTKFWMLITLAIIFAFSLLAYTTISQFKSWNLFDNQDANSTVYLFYFYHDTAVLNITLFGGIFMFGAAILGILIGISQFWVPFFTNTWKFTLHRPIKRSSILSVMLFNAAIIFALIIGGSWSFLWLNAALEFDVYPSKSELAQGWLFALEGFMIYLAIALTALNCYRWFTIKLYPLMFVLISLGMIWSTATFLAAISLAAIYFAVILPLLYYEFEKREF